MILRWIFLQRKSSGFDFHPIKTAACNLFVRAFYSAAETTVLDHIRSEESIF